MISTIETHDDGASRPRRCVSSPLVAIRRGDVASMVAMDQPQPQRRRNMNDDKGRPISVGDTVQVLFINRDRGAEMWMHRGVVVGFGRTRVRVQFSARNEPQNVGNECLRVVDEIPAVETPDPALVAAYAATIERAVDGRW